MTKHSKTSHATTRRRSHSKKSKSILAYTIGALVLLVIGSTLAYRSGFSINESVSLYIYDDDNIESVKQRIKQDANPQSMMAFNIYSTVLSLNKHLNTGRYEITPDMSMLQLVRHIRNHTEQPVNLVVPSVRTMSDMAGRLSHHLMLDSITIIRALQNDDLLMQYGYTRETVPAMFIPNTYEVYWDISIEALIERIDKENKAFWNRGRREKIANVAKYAETDMDEVSIMTLASIVDSETANNGEKPNIAGLYLNRLRTNMPLQSDPTVKYALADFALRRILQKHLDVDSPFNTYKNTGLPPGPICVPSVASIDAVLNFASHKYIYMCAKEDFSGTHNFAETYAQHLKNAARYTLALNLRNIH